MYNYQLDDKYNVYIQTNKQTDRQTNKQTNMRYRLFGSIWHILYIYMQMHFCIN